jgi:hypothetical protein
VDPRGTTDSRSRGAGKRWLFSLVLLLLLYGFVEGGASLALWYLDGASFSLERLDRERSERSTEQAAVATPERPDQRPWWMKSEILHPYLGFVINPALRKAAPHPISDFGFIDVAAPLHRRAEDRLIVGIFGGSVAQSFQSEGTDTLAELLTGSDAFAGREVVFVRTALPGYKQPQQLMTLTYLLSQGAEFDIVINLDGFNEIALHPTRNGPQGVSASYPTNWALRVQKQIDLAQQRMLGELVVLRDRQADWARSFEGGVRRYSVLMNLLWRVRDRRLEALIREQGLAIERYQPSRHTHEATGPRDRFADDDAMFDGLAEAWLRASLQMHRLSRANGIRYLHFLQPSQYLRGSKPMGRQEQIAAVAVDARQVVLEGYERLMPAGERLRGAGVSFHDLTGVFADVEEPIYIDACCHVNPRGNQLLARAIGEAILHQPEATQR